MEDIIPFLIVVLISIVGAIGNKKRKRNAGENIAEPRRSAMEDDIFDWLDKLKISDEVTSPYDSVSEDIPIKHQEEQIIKEPVVEAAPIPGIFDKYSGFISPKEREEIMAKEGIPVVKINHFTEGDLTKQNINSLTEIKRKKIELDMRKVVIYNEIYNRKYKF